jgi:hypothetical protein
LHLPARDYRARWLQRVAAQVPVLHRSAERLAQVAPPSTKANSRSPSKTLLPANNNASTTFTFGNYETILCKISGLSSSTGRGNGVAVGSKPLQSVRDRRRVMSCVLAAQQRSARSDARGGNTCCTVLSEIGFPSSAVEIRFAPHCK